MNCAYGALYASQTTSLFSYSVIVYYILRIAVYLRLNFLGEKFLFCAPTRSRLTAILRQWVILSEVEPVGRRSMRRNLIVVKFRQAQDDPSEKR